MAHLEVSFSSVIKESQAATEALGKIEQAISGTVPAFDAAKQITIPKGTPADVWAIIRYWRNKLRRIPR